MITRQSILKQVCIRMDGELYSKVRKMAESRRVSVNRLVLEGLNMLADESLHKDMKKAYELLSQDTEETDVEKYCAAQSEVIHYCEQTAAHRNETPGKSE